MKYGVLQATKKHAFYTKQQILAENGTKERPRRCDVLAGLAAARVTKVAVGNLCSDSPPGCHSFRSRRFATLPLAGAKVRRVERAEGRVV